MQMHLPEFFAASPRLRVFDPLADFLGAAQDGVFEYVYADVVKLAGHSCPTVASAFRHSFDFAIGTTQYCYTDVMGSPFRFRDRTDLRQ